jgi:predicted dehydrogenase
MSKKIRVGIAGLDHFYVGLGALQDLASNPDAEVVVVAHRDEKRGREAAEKAGARWTDDYASVVDADIDLLITACPTVENAALVIAAAERGKHIISVKPFAMNMEEADRIVAAVKKAGVHFMSFDASDRFSPLYRQARTWLEDGTLGKPISVYAMMRSTLPTLQWFSNPPEHGRTWWLDPKQSPGGGWIDHSIYYIDGLRWLFNSEVTRVSGETSQLKHPDEALEDFGIATLTFANGAIAFIEVTWTAEAGGFATALQLVGTNGQLLSESLPGAAGGPSVRRISYGGANAGWQPVDAGGRGESVVAHMLDVLQNNAQPLTNEDESRATLAACFAFYRAAKEHCSVTP